MPQLYINDCGRLQYGGRELTCGDCLEVLTVDKISNDPTWTRTRVEHREPDGYYLTGLEEFCPVGLFARGTSPEPISADIPGNVAGMRPAELQEFKVWLRECCGYCFETMTYNQLSSAASQWYDEQWEEANRED